MLSNLFRTLLSSIFNFQTDQEVRWNPSERRSTALRAPGTSSCKKFLALWPTCTAYSTLLKLRSSIGAQYTPLFQGLAILLRGQVQLLIFCTQLQKNRPVFTTCLSMTEFEPQLIWLAETLCQKFTTQNFTNWTFLRLEYLSFEFLLAMRFVGWKHAEWLLVS
jgi:hypothetical protein